MNQIVTQAIVLSRTNFGEADRILTLLTPDHGKLSAMAKGVRKSKSKLAAGTELFSVSEVGFIKGRGDVSTLTSARLQKHFGQIVNDMQRTMYAYEVLKVINKITEDNADREYFELVADVLLALDDATLDFDVIQSWADMQLLSISGHTPNLEYDVAGGKLDADAHYTFDYDSVGFAQHPEGAYGAGHIKLLRLLASQRLQTLSHIDGIGPYILSCQQLLRQVRKQILHM